ncbi:hypothetical protein B0I35DRAFT_349601 [Stachybotrys elegans]|uniref:NAD-dependent epimerase/dehydratase domain-containing protein n=1 Tax=Stachybotrys elegans TaxID=80388 RepID=A0A8K0WU00_9HYPO|nr:hypothetical protein B0I35DRAFT_349601 [Stachybotrys elegans]
MAGTILITGASGYVGGQILNELLKHGYDVRLVARSEQSADKAISNFPGMASRFSKAIVPDITKAEAYKDAFDGVTGVIHTASPFVLHPDDNVKDLLEPAVNASLAILQAAHEWGHQVTRVVATSSFASINDVLKAQRVGYQYDEKDWNPMTWEEASTAPGVVAYCASKALAERAMWDYVRDNKPKFTLATICPPWVFGPYAHEITSTKHLSESLGQLHSMIGASDVPPFDFGGCADSREVASAHVLALEKPEAAGERFLVGQEFRFQMAADVARAAFPQVKDRIPEGQPGYKEPAYNVDGSKATRVLGLQYRPVEETLKDSFAQILHAMEVEGTA